MDLQSAISNASWANPVDGERLFAGANYTAYGVIFLITIVAVHTLTRQKTNAPLVNPDKFFEFVSTRSKMEFVVGARNILQEAAKRFPKKCFQVMADSNKVVIMPPEFAHDIRNHQNFDFVEFLNKVFMPHLHGMAAFGASPAVIKHVVQTDLTKYLNKVTQPLHDETTLAMADLFTNNKEWHEMHLNETILRLVARISSRVFLGKELCRNEEWLKVTREFTLVGFHAAEQLRLWPAPMRRIVARFHPACRNAAALTAEARRIIEPVVQRRRLERSSGVATEHNDAIEWFDAASKGQDFDAVLAQLTISVAAIHTTTDLLCQTLLCIAQNPDILEPLRKEITQCLTEGGWKKTTLYSMKLLDSCIKESQRLKPVSLVGMSRVTTANVTLPDGTILPKGTMTAVSAHHMWDPAAYENPEVWDGARFYKRRQREGQENSSQLVSTTPDHLGFGHGHHACPGRFFAANEVKMALVHILMKYDFKLVEGQKPEIRYFGFAMSPDPFIKVMVKRRDDGIDLDSF